MQFTENFKMTTSFNAPNNFVDGKTPITHDLPGNPVVKTKYLHGRGRGFYGWSKYWDAACHIVKQNKQTKKNRWPDPWINLDALNQNFWASS